MQTSRVRRGGVLFVGLALVLAACGGDDSTGPVADTTDTTSGGTTPQTTEAMPDGTTAPTTAAPDGTTPADVAGALAGMKGTTPLIEVSQDFKDRLATVPSGADLSDYNYAGETYDAFVIIALAAEVAGTDGIDMAKEIDGVTRDGEKCTTYADCLALGAGRHRHRLRRTLGRHQAQRRRRPDVGELRRADVR